MKHEEKNSGTLRMGENYSTEGAVTRPLGKDGTPARLVALFGSLGQNGEKHVHYVFDAAAPTYLEITLTTSGLIRSISLEVPAAAWYER